MATYVNDLRLTELATGEGSGTWGTTTNTNLELIGEALGFGTQDCFGSDADATTTVADGSTDPARSMFFKVTSSATLSATRTLTIAPNTLSQGDDHRERHHRLSVDQHIPGQRRERHHRERKRKNRLLRRSWKRCCSGRCAD